MYDQSRLGLTLEIFVAIIVLACVVVLARLFYNKLARSGWSLSRVLSYGAMNKVFRGACYLLVAAGAVSLWITLFPNLTPPFINSRINQNLELGGIVLLFLYPILATQIVVGIIISKKALTKSPVMLWMLLLILYLIFINIDLVAIRLLYN